MTTERGGRVGLAAVLWFLAVGATACASGSGPAAPVQGPIGPPRLRFETVRAILHDSKGNHWFGSWNEGVCRFDGKDLTYFTTADGLADNQVRSIQEDRDGVVWFECASGISGFDGQRLVTPPGGTYAALDDWRSAPDDLWFKEQGPVGATGQEERPGAYRYDGTTLSYHAYPVLAERDRIGAYATTGFARGQDGRLWFATYAAVFGHDGKSFTVLDDHAFGLDERTGRLHVRCVLEDRKGRLWIGNNGIGVILREGAVTTQFTQQMGLGKMGSHGDRRVPLPGDVTDGSPTLHRVFSIGEDRDGNIWFGTIDHGAWRYDGKTLRNFGVADGLTSKDVMAIYTDRDGRLWLGGNGVFWFNGTTFERRY